MRGITKAFPGVVANDNTSFDLRSGEVHALLGENGAGKSTLMNILFGIYTPDAGQIILSGQPMDVRSPSHAYELGLGMVHQHFKLVQNFTVTENVILGVEEVRRGFVQTLDARRRIVELSREYSLDVDPDARISDISVGMQQRVEILKVLFRKADIIILDEPTAVLTPQQIQDLMRVIRQLRDEGRAIVFISHKLDEIVSIADRCTVLKLGKNRGTVSIGETTKQELSNLMVGRTVDFAVHKEPAQVGAPVLTVEHLTYQTKHSGKPILNDVSFSVRAGEVVSLAGIDGNGQTELVFALTGLIPHSSGRILLNGTPIEGLPIRDRTMAGISHIPEDRHKHGLVLDYPLEYNLALQEYFRPRFQRRGFLRFGEITAHARQLIDRFDIRSGQGAKTPTRSMSGGNQQKAILAREISRSSDLLIAVQPTRGLDVGAIEYVHRQIISERDKGKAVLVVSLELDEVMSISDRILVIYEGELVGELDPATVTYEEIGLYMSGAKRGAPNV
ncbi:MAG: ABC transporter ATP-binding protein [Spirochaetaceae bacterium]|nr:MAG: ABC transporter ATP-binding protein [Spirochaetaceae bacterium]